MEKPRRTFTLETICGHEAAHAVMRYLTGLSATQLTASADGGFCEGTGTRIDARQALLVTLAGIAWEAGFRARIVDLRTSDFVDLDEARAILSAAPQLRIFVTRGIPRIAGVERSLRRALDQACVMLRPFAPEIEALSANLATSRKLSARSVAAFMRERIGADRN